MLANNLGYDRRTVIKIVQPMTCGSVEVVTTEPTLEKRPVITGAWAENDKDVIDDNKKPTVPFLDEKTGAGFIHHAIRMPPYVRGATMVIMY